MACTRKDLVKLRLAELGGRPLYAPHVELEILEGVTILEEMLEKQANAGRASAEHDAAEVITWPVVAENDGPLFGPLANISGEQDEPGEA